MKRPDPGRDSHAAAAALLATALVALVNPGVLRHPHSLRTPAQHGDRHAACGRCQQDHITAPFVGVAINPPIARAAHSFASATGVRPGVVEFYTAFLKPFPRYEAAQAAGRGSLPLVQVNFRGVSLAKVASGHYDRYLRRYAMTVKAFSCQVAISLGHEMNGSWYSWGLPDTGPATFIAAWRHIHRIFTAGHVRNVTWSFDPDHVWQPAHGGSWAKQWWPGRPMWTGSGSTDTSAPANLRFSVRQAACQHPFLHLKTSLHRRNRSRARTDPASPDIRPVQRREPGAPGRPRLVRHRPQGKVAAGRRPCLACWRSAGQHACCMLDLR